MNPRLWRIPGWRFFRKKFVRLGRMPESFIEAPLFRMLTPPSSSPRESHEIFMQLLARHEPVIRGYLRSLVARAADVDELMPDVALVAWRKFSELREPEALRGPALPARPGPRPARARRGGDRQAR